MLWIFSSARRRELYLSPTDCQMLDKSFQSCALALSSASFRLQSWNYAVQAATSRLLCFFFCKLAVSDLRLLPNPNSRSGIARNMGGLPAASVADQWLTLYWIMWAEHRTTAKNSNRSTRSYLIAGSIIHGDGAGELQWRSMTAFLAAFNTSTHGLWACKSEHCTLL